MLSELKLLCAILATVISIASYYPYIRDILSGSTKPHAYTWLIWMITQGVATAGIWFGGGYFGAMILTANLFLISAVFFLSLKYGTKDITKSDTAILVIAFLAIVVWWQLKNPLLAVFMVTAIDAIGYIPTYRKTYNDPWSETVLYWVAMVVTAILALLANAEYNLLTSTYLVMLVVVETPLLALIAVRRKYVLESTTSTI